MKRIFPFAVFLCFLIGFLSGCSDTSRKVPPPCYVQLERNGVVYEEYALQGQVWLLFKDYVTPEEAAEFLWENGAKIIDSQTEIGYYLVEVKPGTEGEFVTEMQSRWEVDYVYPNAIHELQSAMPYVIDNFAKDHGKKVTRMMEEASKTHVEPKDMSIFIDKVLGIEVVDDYKVKNFLQQILGDGTKNSCVVNMSIGPGLGRNKNGKKRRWYDEDMTNSLKQDYINRSISDLIGFVKYTQVCYTMQWKGLKDFVIVKAAGNEAMKNMEIIFDGVRQELSYNEYKFFKDHFLIVSAKDDHKGKKNNVDYPNDVYNGGFHEMMSKVDISDKTVLDTNWCGTSFSSPRLGGYIVRAANQFEMPVTEVLPYVRMATKKAPEHVVDYEMIEKEIKQEGVDPVNDMIGQTIKDPSENGYFGRDWSWKLEPGEVMSVSEVSREAFDKNTIIVTVFARLFRGELEVDATVAMIYKKTSYDSQLSYIRTLDLTIPEQTDYSQYIDVKNEGDFSTIEVYNHSPYKLFVVGDFVTLNGNSHRFVAIIEPEQSETVAALTIMDSYSIRFAYRM